MEFNRDNRFLVRKEEWGYLLQDTANDRIWGIGNEYALESICSDDKYPIISNKPYSYTGDFYWGDKSSIKSLSAPISISWSITAGCNSKCVFCCTDSLNNTSNREASVSEISQIIDVLEEWGVLRIIIGGGEPLIRNDIESILELFKTRRIKPVLATNGILLDTIEQQLLVDTVINVQISLDTLIPEKYKKIRGVNCLERVKKNIEKISMIHPLTRIVTVLNNYNADELDDIADYLNGLKIKQWFIFDLLKSGRGNDCYDEMHFNDMSYIKERIEVYKKVYPDLSVWYWGNQQSDSVAIYIMPDGRLHLVDYQNNTSYVYNADELDLKLAQTFWENLSSNLKKDVLINFTCKNRME